VARPLPARFSLTSRFSTRRTVGTEVMTTLDVTDIVMTPLDTGRFVIAVVRSALDGETGFIPRSRRQACSKRPARDEPQVSRTTGTASSPHGRRSRHCRAGASCWRDADHTANPTAAPTSWPECFQQWPLGKVVQVNTLREPALQPLRRHNVRARGDVAFLAWADDSKAGADKAGAPSKTRDADPGRGILTTA